MYPDPEDSHNNLQYYLWNRMEEMWNSHTAPINTISEASLNSRKAIIRPTKDISLATFTSPISLLHVVLSRWLFLLVSVWCMCHLWAQCCNMDQMMDDIGKQRIKVKNKITQLCHRNDAIDPGKQYTGPRHHQPGRMMTKSVKRGKVKIKDLSCRF